jgi:hypothetical protein
MSFGMVLCANIFGARSILFFSMINACMELELNCIYLLENGLLEKFWVHGVKYLIMIRKFQIETFFDMSVRSVRDVNGECNVFLYAMKYFCC